MMVEQSANIYFNGEQNHKDIYYDGHYHNAMYKGGTLIWEKIKRKTLKFFKTNFQKNMVFSINKSQIGIYAYKNELIDYFNDDYSLHIWDLQEKKEYIFPHKEIANKNADSPITINNMGLIRKVYHKLGISDVLDGFEVYEVTQNGVFKFDGDFGRYNYMGEDKNIINISIYDGCLTDGGDFIVRLANAVLGEENGNWVSIDTLGSYGVLRKRDNNNSWEILIKEAVTEEGRLRFRNFFKKSNGKIVGFAGATDELFLFEAEYEASSKELTVEKTKKITFDFIDDAVLTENEWIVCGNCGAVINVNDDGWGYISTSKTKSNNVGGLYWFSKKEKEIFSFGIRNMYCFETSPNDLFNETWSLEKGFYEINEANISTSGNAMCINNNILYAVAGMDGIYSIYYADVGEDIEIAK